MFESKFIMCASNMSSYEHVRVMNMLENWGLPGDTLFEPRHEENNILQMRKTKTQISFAVTVKLISAFVFAT